MIIFGARYKELDTVHIPEGICPACGADGVELTIKQQYFHLYFIPMFPTVKTADGKCRRCKRIYDKSEFTGDLGAAVTAAKKAEPTSPILFLGLVIVAMIIAYTVVHSQQKSNLTAEYIAQPKVNDLYILPLSDDSKYKFMIVKVNGITADSVFVSGGDYGYATASDAEDAIDKGKTSSEYFGHDDAATRGAFANMVAKYRPDIVVIRPH